MIPAGVYDGNKIKLASEGVEVKGSQRVSGWQGHNAEDTWLMVFVFESNKPVDKAKGAAAIKPFRFCRVVGTEVAKDDWQFSGRSATSRRTITAGIKPSGREKMYGNWIYIDPSLKT